MGTVLDRVLEVGRASAALIGPHPKTMFQPGKTQYDLIKRQRTPVTPKQTSSNSVKPGKTQENLV